MKDIITTNDVLNDIFQRLGRLFSIKVLQEDYSLTLHYRGDNLLGVEVWVWNQLSHKRDDKDRFELSEKISRKLKLATNPSQNYSELKAEYTVGDCKVAFLVHI